MPFKKYSEAEINAAVQRVGLQIYDVIHEVALRHTQEKINSKLLAGQSLEEGLGGAVLMELIQEATYKAGNKLQELWLDADFETIAKASADFVVSYVRGMRDIGSALQKTSGVNLGGASKAQWC